MHTHTNAGAAFSGYTHFKKSPTTDMPKHTYITNTDYHSNVMLHISSWKSKEHISLLTM
jgi:hypothetical protein